jgi:hypothetical protein
MPQSADPDFVNAVVRGDVPGVMPTCITVFCDVCGVEHTGDYLVGEDDPSAVRLGYARAHMREQGWRCDERGDLCPPCAAADAEGFGITCIDCTRPITDDEPSTETDAGPVHTACLAVR